MKSSNNILAWVFQTGIWFSIFYLKLVNSFEENWHELEPVKQQLFNSFITMCEKKGKSSENIRMEDELNDCISSNLDRIMKPIMMNNGENPRKIAIAILDLKMAQTLSSEQVDLIGRNIVEPVCQLLPAMLICSKPYQYPLIKSCYANPEIGKIILDYREIIIQATCKYNGNRVVDFLAASGTSCFSLIITDGIECFRNISIKETTATNADDLCGLLESTHNCLAKSFESCGGKVTLRILNLILEDVNSWVSNMCATVKSNSLVKKPTSISSKLEFSTISILSASLLLLNLT